MKRKTIVQIAISSLAIIMLISFMFGNLAKWFANNDCKIQSNRINDLLLKGFVVEKYKDSLSHMDESIIINNKSIIQKIIVFGDRSGLYNYLQPGDSLSKPVNSLECTVYRDTLVKVFIIDFGCK